MFHIVAKNNGKVLCVMQMEAFAKCHYQVETGRATIEPAWDGQRVRLENGDVVTLVFKDKTGALPQRYRIQGERRRNHYFSINGKANHGSQFDVNCLEDS